MSPSRPNGVVNFFVVNAYRVVSEFVVISGKLFREHWSTFSLTFTIEKGHPYYIKTNVNTIQIVLHNKERLIILPDKVFFVRKRKVGMIDYNDFRISVSSVRFVERDPIPKDAQVVGQTWQYVNKNGTPDQRFKNNKQIPVCLYGQVFLRSPSGLNVELQISNVQNARDFAELIT
jgi:hypothetical protein